MSLPTIDKNVKNDINETADESQPNRAERRRQERQGTTNSTQRLTLVDSNPSPFPLMSEILAEKGILGLRPGGKKGRCHACGHQTYSIAPSNKMGQCWRCGQKDFASQRTTNRIAIYKILDEAFQLCRDTLLTRQPESKEVWTWLEKRKIPTEITKTVSVGAVPQDWSLSVEEKLKVEVARFQDIVNQEQQNRPRPSGKAEKKSASDAEKNLASYKGMLEKLKRLKKTDITGWIVFAYRDDNHQVLAMKFRRPGSPASMSRWFKPQKHLGVFGLELFSLSEAPSVKGMDEHLFVLEGEFDYLQFISAFCRHGDHKSHAPFYPAACAIGGANSADYDTLRSIDRPIIACYDNDDAGRKFVKTTQKHFNFEVFTTPGAKDLDEYLKNFTGNPEGEWTALLALIEGRRFVERDYGGLITEIAIVRRGEGMKPHEVNAAVALIVTKDLGERTAFYHDPKYRYLFFRGPKLLVRIEKDGQTFKNSIHQYGINPSEKLFEYVREAIDFQVFKRGTRTQIHSMAYFDQDRSTLHVFNNKSQTYRITPQKIDLVDNGTDGVLFLNNENNEPFVADITDHKSGPATLLETIMFDPINFDADKLSPNERRLLYKLWFFATFFESLLPTKILLLFYGQKGSGKSLTLRKFMRFLFGARGDVSPVSKERDFDAVITSHPVAAFDNVDTAPDWLENKLAVVATGGSLKMAKLYVTNQLVEYPIHCFLGLTSRTPDAFRRDDVADRLLPLKVKRFDSFKPEAQLLGEVTKNRDQLWTETVHALQEIVRALDCEKDVTLEYNFRLADFASFIQKISRRVDWCDEQGVCTILKKLGQEQSSFALDGDSTFDLLWMWSETNCHKSLTNGALFQELQLLSMNEKIELVQPSVRSLGQWMSNVRSNLDEVFNITEKSAGKNRIERRFTRKIEETDGV